MQSRTYLRRRGRITRGQARALETDGERLVRVAGSPREMVDWFGRAAPLGVEIGFGMGEALLQWAETCPDWNLVGIDVYQPGIGALLLGAQRAQLSNLRVLAMDANQAVAECFAPGSLQEVRIFFPDPWPKKRHHKRRLIQPDFVSALGECLQRQGRLLVATDWQPYAEVIRDVLDHTVGLRNLYPGEISAPRPPGRPVTRFEAKGTRRGHKVWDFAYVAE